MNFIEVKYKAQRKYNKLFKILEKEKFDLQFQLDSEQKGIHARRDSEVCTKQRQKSFQFSKNSVKKQTFFYFHIYRHK